MAQQKLYTEEQVLNTVNAIQSYIEKFGIDGAQPTIKNHLKMLSPIELPSDEEIDKKAYNWCQVEHDENGFIRAGDDYDIKELSSFIGGAKWMKEQILNQNNNQRETLEEWKSKFTHHCAIKPKNK